jgi:hypothetical protein
MLGNNLRLRWVALLFHFIPTQPQHSSVRERLATRAPLYDRSSSASAAPTAHQAVYALCGTTPYKSTVLPPSADILQIITLSLHHHTSTMAIPFGFSVGDFIAISRLAFEISQYASASLGLRTQIQTLMIQYAELRTLMCRIMDTCLSGETKIEIAVGRCMEYHLGRCREHLETFERETRAVTGSLKGQGTVTRMKRIAQRMKLMPRKDALFEELHTKFRHDVEAFRLCAEAVTL